MYYIVFGSSLLIESTDSKIRLHNHLGNNDTCRMGELQSKGSFQVYFYFKVVAALFWYRDAMPTVAKISFVPRI